MLHAEHEGEMYLNVSFLWYLSTSRYALGYLRLKYSDKYIYNFVSELNFKLIFKGNVLGKIKIVWRKHAFNKSKIPWTNGSKIPFTPNVADLR